MPILSFANTSTTLISGHKVAGLVNHYGIMLLKKILNVTHIKQKIHIKVGVEVKHRCLLHICKH